MNVIIGNILALLAEEVIPNRGMVETPPPSMEEQLNSHMFMAKIYVFITKHILKKYIRIHTFALVMRRL